VFENRKLIIATKHKKEQVIAPIFEKELGVICLVDDSFDTDTLGTFTGEIERKDDPITTVKNKCLQAMQLNNCSLGVASEGSFGAHPSAFFVHADDEFLIFIDTENDLEIIAREVSTNTNFNGKEINNEKELIEFAQQVKFPSHKIILRKSKDENLDIFKNINDKKELIEAFNLLIAKHGQVYAETDMRAMNNPSRMEVIKAATLKLIDKIKSQCPDCKAPGFGLIDYKTGLPCSLCCLPTKGILADIYECKKCGFTKEELFPKNKKEEDPMFCDYCNP
jgi:hypothetical protein